MGKRALVLGATGLVGSSLTEQLLEEGEWSEVRLAVRRAPRTVHPRLRAETVDWDNLERHKALFDGVDAVFCALGTTIKKAGSQPAFEQVDLHYPLKAAELAKQAGVRQFLAVSSMGADSCSRNFYIRTKGRFEEGLTASGFYGLHLFRPSLLLGEREEFRSGERAAAAVMKTLDFMMAGPLAKYRAIPGSVVARAMINIAQAGTGGVHVYSNDVIHVLGARQDHS